MSAICFIGIDPGSSSGGVAFIDGDYITGMKLEGATERDVCDFLQTAIDRGEVFAFIERVGARPGQGVSSMFKFGQSYGMLRGLLVGMKIPFDQVTPQKWQKAMGCMTKGDKNVSKAKAQQLFPGERITHAVADALLIAEFCRRLRTGALVA